MLDDRIYENKKKRAPRLGNSRTVTNPFLISDCNLIVWKSQLKTKRNEQTFLVIRLYSVAKPIS